MKKNSASQLAVTAIFFAVMLVIHYLSSRFLHLLPFPIKPTLIHIPVIIASIVYGPRMGASLGFLMGVISVTHNTIFQITTSYLFSPFVENGNMASLVIAMVPRILIGITPYYVYKTLHHKFGLALAGVIGSMTNTVFVLGGIFLLFSSVYQGDIKAMLAGIVGSNAIAEMVISVILVSAIVPTLEKIKK